MAEIASKQLFHERALPPSVGHPADPVNLRRVGRSRMLPYASIIGLRSGTGRGVFTRRLGRHHLGGGFGGGLVVTEASGRQDH
jgi:hypothetical protein